MTRRVRKRNVVAATFILVLLILFEAESTLTYPEVSIGKPVDNFVTVQVFRPSVFYEGFPSQGCLSLKVCPASRQLRIAVVKPVFTTTAYSSFYRFYSEYKNVSKGIYVKKNLNLLNVTVLDGWGHSIGLFRFLNSTAAKASGLIIGDNTMILTDIDVNNNFLSYANGSRKFDVVVLGFTEYVTENEYLNYKHFVESGGKLVLLSACNFLAEVSYNQQANKLALVKGHDWTFNGTAAWKGVSHRWAKENTNWIGSEYALFYAEGYHISSATANATDPIGAMMIDEFGPRLFSSYKPHEENAITNSTVQIIAYWQVNNLKNSVGIVAAYEHSYQKGIVIHTGIFGTDIIATDPQMQFFLLASIGIAIQENADLTV